MVHAVATFEITRRKVTFDLRLIACLTGPWLRQLTQRPRIKHVETSHSVRFSFLVLYGKIFGEKVSSQDELEYIGSGQTSSNTD